MSIGLAMIEPMANRGRSSSSMTNSAITVPAKARSAVAAISRLRALSSTIVSPLIWPADVSATSCARFNLSPTWSHPARNTVPASADRIMRRNGRSVRRFNMLVVPMRLPINAPAPYVNAVLRL